MEKEMEQLLKKAQVLIEALPYIQQFNRKIIVVKYGGSAMSNEELQKNVIKDVTLLKLVGFKPVIVHGGGKEISRWVSKVGKEAKFVNGLRYTDKDTAEVVQMVLSGKTNKDLVSLIETEGGKAVGLCGIDGAMIKCVKKTDDGFDYGFVGEITEVDPAPIEKVLEEGYIPVIATVGIDGEGQVYNINADTAAAKIAGVLGAESFISMTDIAGILRDKDDPSTLIPKIYVSEIPELVNEGVISGGMIPKIDCCGEAIRRGVKKVFIIDGRIPHSLLIEILTDEGLGTMFVQS
jgi:acetylglutamate kinase